MLHLALLGAALGAPDIAALDYSAVGFLPAAPEREPPGGAGRHTRLYSCADRVPAQERPSPWISALHEPERCVATLAELFREALSLPADPWSASSAGAAVVWEAAGLEQLERAPGEDAARAWIRAQLDVS